MRVMSWKIYCYLFYAESWKSQLLFSFCFIDSPVCKDNQRVNYPASIGELVDITCEVIANPNKVTFTWTKKHNETNYTNLQSNSLSFLSEPMTATWPTSMATSTSRPISTNIIKSVLKVNVESTSDFAVYTCLAENVIGGNLEPCSFTIEPQGLIYFIFHHFPLKKINYSFNWKATFQRLNNWSPCKNSKLPNLVFMTNSSSYHLNVKPKA